jgi:class 3 adenylate cyclase
LTDKLTELPAYPAEALRHPPEGAVMSVLDAFQSPESRVERTIVFVDLVDSTGMKEREPESSWVPTIAWLYRAISDQVQRGGAGQIVKFLGDGVMIAYVDGATQAINDAIGIQETIRDAVFERRVRLECACALASGEVVAFLDAQQNEDYLGLVVDRAARLCSIASAQAIFVDARTIASAQLNKVRSSVGVALRRSIEDYCGAGERAGLRGFVEPVRYHEIRWDQGLFGPKPHIAPVAPPQTSTQADGGLLGGSAIG